MKTREDLEKMSVQIVDALAYDERLACFDKQIDFILEALIKVQDEALIARLPSEQEWVDWAHSWPSPHQAEAIFRTRNWLRANMKPADKEAGET